MLFRRPALMLLIYWLQLSAAAGDATNQVVTLTPSLDTSIVSAGENPRGTDTILVGTRGANADGIRDRGLLRFDLTSIPTNSQIESVVLQLTVVAIPQAPVVSDFSLYRMLTNWDESASWEAPLAGAAWGSPGGQEGVDRAVDASVSQSIEETGEYDFGPSDGLLADVKGWMGSPLSNHGWMLFCEMESTQLTARHFGASESSDPPRLIVEYRPPVSEGAPVLEKVNATNGLFSFSFKAAAGKTYLVQSRTNFNTGAWVALTNFPARTITTNVLVTNALNGFRGFFRVLVP